MVRVVEARTARGKRISIGTIASEYGINGLVAVIVQLYHGSIHPIDLVRLMTDSIDIL